MMIRPAKVKSHLTGNIFSTGCPKINETHKIANKYVDFNPIVYIFQI